MAVEIPVVIDIEKAFDDAAARVDQAIKPLKQKIEDSTANLKLKTGSVYDPATDSWKKIEKTVAQIVNLTTKSSGMVKLGASAEEVATALGDAQNRYAQLIAIQEKGGAVDKQRVYDLRSAIVVLTAELEHRRHSVNLVTQETERIIAATRAEEQRNFIISQEAKTIASITERIGALRGKLDNLPLKGNASEWTKTGREIQKATAELAKFQAKYAEVTTKPGSINRITAEMQALSDKWNAMSRTMKFDKDGNLKASAQKIVEKYRQLTQEAEKYGRSLQSYVKSATPELQKQHSILGKLVSQFAYYFSIYSALRFAKQIRDVTGELEYQRVALGHLIQDEEYGAQLFERVKNAAKESPFRITQLVTYTKQLAAYRIEQENLFDTTQRLADISAGLGVDMNRLILAYGQVRAASVLRGQELRQFTEAGIPLVDELAKKFSELKGTMVSTADVFKLISARAVPFKYISEIFEDLTDKGGMFYKMQEEQAKTLKGRWEKLKDAYDIALQSIGENDTFQKWNDSILKNLNAIAKNLRQIVRVANAAGIAWGVYAIATRTALTANVKFTASLFKEYGAVNVLKLGVTGLTSAFKKLVTVLKSNWVGLALSAVAGVITYFTAFKKQSDNVTDSVDEMEKAIEKMSKANKDSDKEERLITRYEALSKNINRTADENLALAQTMNKLREAYPELINVIGDENTALDAQVQALKDAREAKLDDAKKEASERLNIEKELNRDLQNQYNEALNAYNDAYKELLQAQGERQEWSEKQKELNESVRDLLSEEDAEKLISELDLDKKTKEAAVFAAQAKTDLDEINKQLEKSNKQITRLENAINPSKQQADWSQWQKEIKGVQDSLLKVGDTPVFTDEEISKFDSVYELSSSLKKKIDDLTTSIKGMKSIFDSMADKGTDAAKALDSEIQASEKTLEMAEAIRVALGLVFGKTTSGTAKTDPFVTEMQNKIKFMQDFKKGYDDLRKYMTESSALGEEAATMLGRGKSLGMEAEEQVRAAKDISAWYQDMITQVQDKLKAKGVKGMTVTDFLGIDTSKKSKAIQDLQKLLQQLWDAKTDFDTSQKKKEIEDAMKELSEKIKQSETARNFYQDIFDMTGDQDLATSMTVSIYGGVGGDFKTRMAEELQNAMKSIDKDILTDGMRQAFEEQDFSKIFSFLDKLPEDWQKRLREMAAEDQKFNADLTKNLLKSLEGAKTYGEKRVELARQTAKRTAEIESMKASDSVKNQLLKQNAKKEAEESAKLAYEAFKDTPMYVELFSNLDAASTKMLRNMRENLISMKGEWKDLTPTELKELQSRINELDEQISRRNPFKTLIDSIKEYRELQAQKSRKQVDEEAIDADKRVHEEEDLFAVLQREYEETVEIWGKESELAKLKEDEVVAQGKILDKARQEADAAQEAANKYKEVGKHILDAAKGMREWSGYISDSLEGVGQIVETFASADTAETFNILAEGIGKTLGGAASAAEGVGKLMTGDISGIADIIRGTGDFIAGTFGTANRIKIKSINKQIESQQDLLDSLETSYGKLDRAIAKAFGSDYIYNYNEQLKNLYAQQEAYRTQARLEDQKGKKKDEQKIKDYNKSAEELGDRIEDMKGKLSEFFTGTDVTSAAQEFANSWIEAYKEFGSTTSAMKERFQDMIQNMITQSLAGKIMQEMLQPIFDEIDSLAQDGDLTAAEIAKISDMANEKIPLIDDAMTNLMNSLAASGMTVRQRVGSFTGIARDIASASEESILGLAAGVNTANFYMSHLPDIGANVAAIKAYLVGDGTALPGRQSTRAAGEEGPSYQDQMLAYAAYLPQMGNDVSAVRSLLDKVIKPRGVSATHYIAIQ